MSAHKYSHALVMSHFQDTGFLSLGDETPPKTRSSPTRISQSWTISEALPPSKPLRSMTPAQNTQRQRQPIPQEEPISSHRPVSTNIAKQQGSLRRSDSVVTQVYAPRRSSPTQEDRRSHRPRSPRGLSGFRASATSQDELWDSRPPSRNIASARSSCCECGGIVQDAPLQSSYFSNSKAVPKPPPGLPGGSSVPIVEHRKDRLVRERSFTPRFELAADPPRQLPAVEATIKPIRRMAPPRSPTSQTPTSTRSSTSWPKPEPATNVSSVQLSVKPSSNGSSIPSSAYSSSEGASNSQPLSSQTSPPTSPSLESIFSQSSRPSQDYSTNDEYSKIPIYDTNDKDMANLPWDEPDMGPAIFRSSPPPEMYYPEPPPSPGSSIDDAAPPPISRVRRAPSKAAIRTSTFASRPQSRRTSALSLPNDTRPKTSSGAPPPLPTSSTELAHPQPLKSHRTHRARSPSLDVRRECTAIPYDNATSGPAPFATTERVAPPPPLSMGLIRASKEKEVDKWKFRSLKSMLGLGGKASRGAGGRGLDSGFMRGLVPS